MHDHNKTAAVIAEKLHSEADVLVFSPVFECRDELLEEICLAVGGRILCLLPCTPNREFRKTLDGGNRFFLRETLPPEEIENCLRYIVKNDHCVVFASVSMLKNENLAYLLNEVPFRAILLLHAERTSVLLSHYDKRLRLLCDLRSELSYTLPVCAFCATDQSAVLRDITASLNMKTPARIYPKNAIADTHLQSTQSEQPIPLFENLVRTQQVQRALVFCSDRQKAEDSYRYFRFFGYRCALSHAGLDFDKRRKAVDRFAAGETDFLFTTSFYQKGFCTKPYTTVFMGMPSDLFLLAGIADTTQNILVYYGQDDATQCLYRIEEDNEIRSQYTNLPAFRLKQERLLLLQQAQAAIQGNIAPEAFFSEQLPHIYGINKEKE